MALVRPVSTMAAYFPSREQHVDLRPTDAFDENDDLVRERPELFTSADVEQATANPGEKRSTRRPRP